MRPIQRNSQPLPPTKAKKAKALKPKKKKSR